MLSIHLLAWRLGAVARAHPAEPAAGVRWVVLAVSAASAPAAAPSRVTSPARPAPPARAARPHAGAGGAARAAVPGAPAWPVYATRVPPSTRVRYRLVDGLAVARAAASGVAAADGSAELEWHRDDAGFALRLATRPPDRPPRDWAGSGTVDAAGVAPQRLAQHERGREVRATAFDRGTGHVHFSGNVPERPFAPGAQDRWSWIAQLAAIAEARTAGGRRLAPGTRWDLQVAGLRGEVERWQFLVLADARAPPELAGAGRDVSTAADRAPGLLHVLREAERPYDLRIEAWLSPALHHLPAGLRMSTPPGPWSLSLWQQEDGPASGAPGSGS